MAVLALAWAVRKAPPFGQLHIRKLIDRAMVVVEGATVRPLSRSSTMLGIGIVLSIFGLGFFCWLLFTLAVYALPFLAGLTAGLAALQSGAGVIGGLVVGFFAGGATLALGQMAFATTRKPVIRIIIGLLYAVPATVAGYQVSFALAGIGMSSGGWQTAFAVIGAVLSGCTAFSRMTLLVPPPDGQGTGGAYSLADERLHDQRH